MNHVGLHALYDVFHSMPQLLQSVIKRKESMPVTELLNTGADPGFEEGGFG